jgi:hypothetical protein
MTFDLMERDFRTLATEEKSQVFTSSFELVDEVLTHTHVVFEDIFLREFTIKLSSHS